MTRLYNHRVDSERPAVRWNQHARWAEPRVYENQWDESNRPSWVVVLLVPGVIAALCWALPADAGPRWSGSTPSQQAVSAADAATITNARGR